MNKLLTTALCGLTAMSAMAQYASQTFKPTKNTDRTLFFSTQDEGQKMPILWGLDTAWPDEGNIRRGVRFIGADYIGLARVSFQPWDFMLEETELTDRLETNLKERLRLVSIIGGPEAVRLVLNNDAPDDVYDQRYSNAAENPDACRAYCNLIYATLKSCQRKGWEVVTASPLNEPDYTYNGQGSMDDFLAIAKMLKTEYPQFDDGSIRISGGNTLNCDCALPWYEYLYDYIDEGNTHQLAGEFDTYADFFTRVRRDGKYATADELHNVMEAIVGVEYGMQAGIWWGTAERTRGEFCRASFGERLAYSENRKAWTAAAVYRNPDGEIKGFVGSSERQAKTCSFRFVSTDRDVFFNGHGPQREYVMDIQGAEGYQAGQTNAEGIVDITWGDDVSPVIDGEYMIMNKMSQKVLAVKGGLENLDRVCQYAPAEATAAVWDVRETPITIGGDYSYHTIKINGHDNMKLDVINWSLDEGGEIIIYDGGLGNNEQWYLKYAGDGYFRIISRHSGLCLQVSYDSSADGVAIKQYEPSDSPKQLWRFIARDAECELTAPDAPTSVKAFANTASISVAWEGAQAADLDSYTVLRAESDNGIFETIARGIKTTVFTDNTAYPGIKYTYKIKAVDKSLNTSESEESQEVAIDSQGSLIMRLLFARDLTDETPNHFDADICDGQRTTYTDGPKPDTKAIKLVDNRFVQIPYQAANHENMTISTWVNLQVKGNEQDIYNFGTDADNYIGLTIDASGVLTFTRCSDGVVETISGGSLEAKQWYHVATTIDGDKVCIYIDGEKCAEGSVNNFDFCPTLNYIGSNQEKSNKYLRINLHDFSIYDFAVASDKVGQLMQGDLGGFESIDATSPVVAVRYINMAGIEKDTPYAGLNIVKQIHADGAVSISKEIRN